MATERANKLDRWIRDEFKDLNTELELLYGNTDEVSHVGLDIKERLLRRGGALISSLLEEGNTDEGFDNGFDLLGDVGFFMAACRRHEVDAIDDSQLASIREHTLKSAAALSLQLGASLGVVPRFASAHLETHNRAENGKYKSFTHLEDERIFLDFNTRGVLAFIRASEALLHCLPLGVSHPVTYDLLQAAERALKDVVTNNEELYRRLNTDKFFYNIRPYYKPHQVGLREYRGANAGDFAGINVIDLLLGLCRADDAYYSQLLVDKFLFMRPQDQLVLRDCMRRKSLMDEFLENLSDGRASESWFQKNLMAFIKVCDAHGETAKQHHDMLINKFIERPANSANLVDKADLTASGPPLDVMLRGLKKLCDLRSAAQSTETKTRYSDLAALRQSIS